MIRKITAMLWVAATVGLLAPASATAATSSCARGTAASVNAPFVSMPFNPWCDMVLQCPAARTTACVLGTKLMASGLGHVSGFSSEMRLGCNGINYCETIGLASVAPGQTQRVTCVWNGYVAQNPTIRCEATLF